MHVRFGAALVASLALLALVSATPALAIGDILANQQAKPDLDARAGSVAPTAVQQQIVASLGAHATWNRFGTPRSLIKYGGYLATGLSSDPVAAAKTFITNNEALFRLSDQGVANLELLNDSPMVGSNGHAVLFRQTFGGLPATQDGLITVGVVDGRVAYVSSSSAGDGNVPVAAALAPQTAWALAAANVGRNISVLDLSAGKNIKGWLTFKANGLNDYQRVRLTALPTLTDGVRPAYESIVLDVQDNGHAEAYTVFVDAVTGQIWSRHNDAQQLAAGASAAASQTCDGTGHSCTFDGTMNGTSNQSTDCGVNGPFTTPANVKSVDVASSADIATNDIILFLDVGVLGNGSGGSSDEGTSPEAVHYEPTGGVPAGTVFWARTCPSPAPAGPFVSPLTYHGELAFNDVSGTQPPSQNTAKWKAFQANPLLNTAPQYPWNDPSTDTRIIWCWLDSLNNLPPTDSNCQYAVKNTASRVPWDAEPHTGATTGTTTGNNATTGEAWVSPLTAGGAHQQPMHPDRAYIDPWTNAWFTSGCNPANLVPGGNDILPAVTNLFVGHNRMHDFSYNLGFTETNFNAQTYNFGNTAPGPYPAGREGDPEEGDVQAGALTGGAPTYLGRDNANQITLNDGVPPITNQYLFQPIAGAFYSPCVDGDFDTSVFAHEYTHMISNRMVAGPDAGLSGYQSGSMGESWSDLDAMEYQAEYGFSTGAGPYVIGAYVTGNPTVGIRDYALDNNPLNYSDLGFDTPGAEVHADGEIWNGTNFDLRQGLIDKYNSTYPYSDAARQKACADGKYAADACPGNRRWIQIVYDAWLLMQSSPSMLDARDAYLAADMMRFGGANQTELWHAFAKRGMGNGAVSAGSGDNQATPSFASPLESNATIIFNATASDEGNAAVKAKIYVGRYEARATPLADTDPGTSLSANAQFVPGTYDFVAEAPGYGLYRFTQTLTAGQTATVNVAMPTNWASSSKGASASGDGTNPGNLIDDTEGTQWESTVAPVLGKQVTVTFNGPHTISRVQVSAMLQAGQSRFSALRQFEIWACTGSVVAGNCSTALTKVYQSAPDAFPGVAPRPVAPNLIMRSFTLPAAVTATQLQLRVDTSQCTGGPAYAGVQDNDPTNEPTDCTAGGPSNEVRAAELEAFGPPPPPPGADLSVVKTGPATGHVGQAITYTIVVTNNGPATANGVLVTDTLPKNTGFGSATSTQGTCGQRPHSQAVDCNVGTMASGATVTITIVAKPTVKGMFVNTATVSSTSPTDPNQANNTSSVTTNVTP